MLYIYMHNFNLNTKLHFFDRYFATLHHHEVVFHEPMSGSSLCSKYSLLVCYPSVFVSLKIEQNLIEPMILAKLFYFLINCATLPII